MLVKYFWSNSNNLFLSGQHESSGIVAGPDGVNLTALFDYCLVFLRLINLF